jgi:flagellar protein FliS
MTVAPAQAYWRTKVMTASPAELRLLLLDGAIRFAQQARDGLARSDYEAVYEGVTRCQSILLELINSLRPEHDKDLCDKLAGLYTYMYTQLLAGSTQRQPELIDEVIRLLQHDRETWRLLFEQLAAENAAAGAIDAAPAAAPTAGPTLAGASPIEPGIIGQTISVHG